MPLSQSVDRELIHSRDIRCNGYLRCDGLWDIEGSLCDTKTYALVRPPSHRVEAGASIHDMKARITIGSDRVIRAIEVAMDAYAFPVCTEVLVNYQRLVGLDVGPGFTKKMHELVGHAQGCTHVAWLLQCMVRVALHTLTKQVPQGQFSDIDVLFSRGGNAIRPALIDSCHAYAADGEAVRTIFPDYFRDPHGR